MSRPMELADMHSTRLEASLMNASTAPRPMSRGAGAESRHATAQDRDMQEFDLDYSVCHDRYPFSDSHSLPDLMASIEFESLLRNVANFDTSTSIECFELNEHQREHITLNEHTLHHLVSRYTAADNTQSERALLCFLIPRVPLGKPATYACKTSMTADSMRELFAWLDIDASFAKNALGRPDYWAPVTRAAIDNAGDLKAFEFSCQHPRWHLTIQGSPLAVYMNHLRKRKLTVYILAHKQNDTAIETLKHLLLLSLDRPQMIRSLLDDPFHIHLMLSNLSFEASKRHVEKFRRFMHEKMEQVHDHLEGVIKTDRSKLATLTAGLQVISQNADSHIANAEVAIMCAEGICAAHKRLHTTLLRLPPTHAYEATADFAEYILSSLRKQKMWFINYKNRKDGAMNLVYNLVTQNDAENNLLIARDMRRDSASMSAIAALTMVFLPGTFTATVIDAGIFHNKFCNDDGDADASCVSNSWWFWLALTVPLTMLVIASWRIYHAYTMVKRREGVLRQGGLTQFRMRILCWCKQAFSLRRARKLDSGQDATVNGAEDGV